METNVICSRSGLYSLNLKIPCAFQCDGSEMSYLSTSCPSCPMWSLHHPLTAKHFQQASLIPTLSILHDVMAVRLNFWYKRQEDVSPLLRTLWCLTDKLLMVYPCSSDPLSCHSVLSAICSQGASPDPFPLTSHPMPHTQSQDNLHLTLKMPLYIPPMDGSFLSPVLPVKCFLLF